MSEWRGLHNPGRHEPYFEMTGSADCMSGECGESCTADRPCRCCLAAEVEVLRAQVDAVREACNKRNLDVADMEPFFRQNVLIDVAVILRILDGGDA